MFGNPDDFNYYDMSLSSMAEGKDFISRCRYYKIDVNIGKTSNQLNLKYMPKCQASQIQVQIYITILYRVSLQPLSLWWHLQSYTTVTSLTMTPDVYLKVGTSSYRATCWYKNLSYSDMSLFYQKQYLSFLMISISATCRNMRGYTVCIESWDWDCVDARARDRNHLTWASDQSQPQLFSDLGRVKHTFLKRLTRVVTTRKTMFSKMH